MKGSKLIAFQYKALDNQNALWCYGDADYGGLQLNLQLNLSLKRVVVATKAC